MKRSVKHAEQVISSEKYSSQRTEREQPSKDAHTLNCNRIDVALGRLNISGKHYQVDHRTCHPVIHCKQLPATTLCVYLLHTIWWWSEYMLNGSSYMHLALSFLTLLKHPLVSNHLLLVCCTATTICRCSWLSWLHGTHWSISLYS